MNRELIIAILAGLGGMVGWGLADFFAKKTIDEIGDITSLAWGHIFGTAVLLLIALYQLVARRGTLIIPSSIKAWALLIFFGCLQGVIYLLVYKGFGKGQVGILSAVFASFSGLTAILSIIFLGEVIKGTIILGLIVLFAGILLINTDAQALKSWRLSFIKVPGLKEVSIATLLAAFWTLSWDKFVGGQDWLSYALFMYLFMTLTILLVSKFNNIKLFVIKSSIWKFLIFIGVCETMAYLAISLGYSSTPLTSVVALLSGAFSLPTIILARLFLKEKITAMQTIGSLTIIAGIMFLAFIK